MLRASLWLRLLPAIGGVLWVSWFLSGLQAGRSDIGGLDWALFVLVCVITVYFTIETVRQWLRLRP